jgi:hypothetical protein
VHGPPRVQLPRHPNPCVEEFRRRLDAKASALLRLEKRDRLEGPKMRPTIVQRIPSLRALYPTPVVPRRLVQKKRDRDDGPPGPRLSFSPVAWERMGLSLEFADLVSCGKPSEAQQSPPAGCSRCSVGAAQAPGPSGVGLAKKPTWPAEARLATSPRSLLVRSHCRMRHPLRPRRLIATIFAS